jgi:hypothetical protein
MFGLIDTIKIQATQCLGAIAFLTVASWIRDICSAAWLAELRVQYKAKRNFMRDLPSR